MISRDYRHRAASTIGPRECETLASMRCALVLLGTGILLACSDGGTTASGVLGTPHGIVATRGPQYVDLTWTAAENAQSYVIEVDNGTAFVQLATATKTTVRIGASKSFRSIDWYTLRVRAVAGAKKSDPSETVQSAPCDDIFCIDARTKLDASEVLTFTKLDAAVVAVGVRTGSTVAFRSTDGGKTWPESSVAPSKPSIGGTFRVAAARGVALFARGSELLRTADAGTTFTVVDLPSAPPGSNASLWDDGTSFQVVRVSSGNSTLWSSPDGSSWTSAPCATCADAITFGAGKLVGLAYEGLSTQKYWVATAAASAPSQWTNVLQLGVTNTPSGDTLATPLATFAWQANPWHLVRTTDGSQFVDVAGLGNYATVFFDGDRVSAYRALDSSHATSDNGGTSFTPVTIDSGVTRWLRMGDRYVVLGTNGVYGATPL